MMSSDPIIQVAMAIIQTAAIIALAPLVVGIIRKVKAWFQNRKGASVLQPYYDLNKLFHKDSVISEKTSWVFKATPYVGMAAVIVAGLMVPFFTVDSLGFAGDLIVVVYLLALFRFFMALAALDAGSAFGGMGSSREMMVSSIVEPTMLLSIFAMALVTGTMTLGSISNDLATTGLDHVGPALFLASVAFFIALLAENARVPFDNPATHLELTMIHEGMLLEYSGKQMALMEWASWGKLVLFAAILSNVFFPWGISTELTVASIAIGTLAILAKVTVIALVISVVESTMAKMRLFRLPNLLTVSFALALLGVTTYYIL